MTTVPPLAESAQIPQESRWRPLRVVLARERTLLGSTVVAIAGGWLFTNNLVYVGGLLLAMIWARYALVRRRNRWLVALTVLLVGLGGPFLAVRLAYLETGTAVDSHVDLVSANSVTTHDSVAVLDGQDPFPNESRFWGLVAVNDSGEQVWARRAGGMTFWPVGDGRVVEAADSRLTYVSLIDLQGDQVWSHSVAPDQGGPVAMDDDTVVVQGCTGSQCTWTGLDLADGTERWELAGAPAPAWHLRDAEWRNVASVFAQSGSSLFVTAGESGRTEVREAATGAVVAEVPAGATPILARDMALILRGDGPCRAELVGGGEAWVTEIDCGLVDQVTVDAPATFIEGLHTRTPDTLGILVGDAWWLLGDTWVYTSLGGGGPVMSNSAGSVVDIRTGAVRNVPPVPRTLGAGVVVEMGGGVELGGGGITVRDPEDGARLWSAPPRDFPIVEARGEFVVLSYGAPLLLGEVFDPGNRADAVVEVREARTGDVVARVRANGSFVIAGDRVFVDLGGAQDGDYRMLMRD